MQPTISYDQKLIAIAEVLLQRTLESKLQWTTKGDDKVVINFPGSSIEISDYLFGHRYTLLVRDDKMRRVRNISASDLDRYYDTFARLYEEARNTALKTDDVLDSILDHLE